MNWGDVLLGHEVTPAGWVGGVCDMSGGWVVVIHYSDETVSHNQFQPVFRRADGNWDYLQNYAPIYPPRGWAGASETVLFDAIADDSGRIWFKGPEFEFHVTADGVIRFLDHYPIASTLSEPGLLILALQNAQLLSCRLRAE